MTGLDDLRGKLISGVFFHAPTPDRIECLREPLITLDDRGRIASLVLADHLAHATLRQAAWAAGQLVVLPGLVLPGLVDLHVHAPQYPQLGKALDVPLEVWLQQHTFPLEARYADLAFARRSYAALVDDLLANGTTTAMYFATLHDEATRLLIDICIDKRQRALVGRVAMDDPAECPPFYRDPSAERALEGTWAMLDYIDRHPGERSLVHAVVTPRFTPSCTDALLSGLGAIAQRTGAHVQTHCSESDWQHGHARSRFGCSDAEALDGFGLLGRRSVLAHGNFLSDEDIDRVASRGSAVAHCPCSNAFFAGAVFPLRRAMARGLRVGLGTDIAGGPSASLFDGMRAAVAVSRMLETGVDAALPPGRRGVPASRLDTRAAFYLATAGGGQALDLPVGTFAPGQHFDAMCIDPDAPAGTIRLWDEEDDEQVLQMVIQTASRANIAGVWTDGRRIGAQTKGQGPGDITV